MDATPPDSSDRTDGRSWWERSGRTLNADPARGVAVAALRHRLTGVADQHGQPRHASFYEIASSCSS